MKFSAERLFAIAQEEYRQADFLPDGADYFTWKEGVGQWAAESAADEYESEDDVREEIRSYIAEEKQKAE